MCIRHTYTQKKQNEERIGLFFLQMRKKREMMKKEHIRLCIVLTEPYERGRIKK